MSWDELGEGGCVIRIYYMKIVVSIKKKIQAFTFLKVCQSG